MNKRSLEVSVMLMLVALLVVGSVAYAQGGTPSPGGRWTVAGGR